MKLKQSISLKISIGYAAILCITFFAAIALNNTTQAVRSQVSGFIEVTLPQRESLEQIAANISLLEIHAYSLYGTTINTEQFDDENSSITEKLNTALSHLQNHGDQNIKPLQEDINQFEDVLGSLRQVMGNNSIDWDQARAVLNELKQNSADIRTKLGQLKMRVSAAANDNSTQINQELSAALRANWIVVMLILAVAGGAYALSKKWVVQPALTLTRNLQFIASKLDLTVDLSSSANDEIAEAANGVNHLLQSFSSGIRDVKTTSSGISETVSTLSQIAQETEASVTQLNQEIVQLVDSMNKVDREIEHAVQSSDEAAQTAKLGANKVDKGSQEVQQTADSIHALAGDLESTAAMLLELRSSGDKVSTVVSTIAEIADQTNLLALNAAIEAARAGESGRGFAVVADEVRTLATRTHHSTVEINNMLESIVSSITNAVGNMDSNQTKAQQSVDLASTTVTSLEEIRQTILNLSGACAEVATCSRSVRDVATNVHNQINRFNEQGSSIAKGSSLTKDTSLNLNQLADQLNTLSDKFKV